jgi:hypothetical protein
MLNLADDPPWPVPGSGPILKVPVAHQRGVAWSAARPREQVLDGPLRDIVGREADGIRHAPCPPRQRGDPESRVSCGCYAIMGWYVQPSNRKCGMKRLGARGRLPIPHGRSRPLPADPPSRVRVARMPRTTREVREPATRAWRVRTVSSKSFLTVVDLREDGRARQHDRSAVVCPPAVHPARRANSCPSHRWREVAAAAGVH